MLNKGLTVEQIALIAAAGWIASAILEVPSGAAADSIGHKRSLIISHIFQGLSMLFYLGGTFPWVLAGTLGYYISSTLMTGTREALFFERLKELGCHKEFKKLIGRSRSISHGFGIGAMALAGIMYFLAPWLPFVIGAFLFFFGAYIISGFQEAKKKVSVKQREGFFGLLRHFPTSVNTILKTPVLFWMMVINSIMMGTMFASSEFHQILLTNAGLAVVLFGIVWSLKRVVTTIVSPFVYKITNRINPPQIFLINSTLTAAYLIIVAFTNNAYLMVLVFLLATAVRSVHQIAFSDYSNRLITSGSRATTLSLLSLIATLINTAVITVFGWLSVTIRLEDAFAIIGVVMFVILITPILFLVRAYQKTHAYKRVL